MGPIQEFLDTYNRSRSKETRQTALLRYLEYLNHMEKSGARVRIDLARYEPLAGAYLETVRDNRRKLINDLAGFMNFLNDHTGGTQWNYLTGVLKWLEFQGIEITKGERQTILRKAAPKAPITEDTPLKREAIAKVLQHAPMQIRALVMVLESSGMRINEALSIKLSDLDMNTDPITIHIRREIAKNKKPRVTFISTEAKPILLQWIDYRAAYLQHKRGAGKYTREETGKLFPFTDNSAIDMLQLALKKSGLLTFDRNTNRAQIHFHSFRQYFRGNLVKGGNGNATDITERLMGHEGYLTGAYLKFTEEDLREFYKSAEHHLWVLQPRTVNSPEVQERMAEQDARIRELEAQNARQQSVISLIESLVKNNPEVLKAIMK